METHNIVVKLHNEWFVGCNCELWFQTVHFLTLLISFLLHRQNLLTRRWKSDLQMSLRREREYNLFLKMINRFVKKHPVKQSKKTTRAPSGKKYHSHSSKHFLFYYSSVWEKTTSLEFALKNKNAPHTFVDSQYKMQAKQTHLSFFDPDLNLKGKWMRNVPHQTSAEWRP